MRKIFTMIELLIVISIIAVLAAMLLPALGKARDRAMAIKCVSNLKNIHLMAVSYLNDNNGRYPYTVLSNIGEPVSNTRYPKTWAQLQDPKSFPYPAAFATGVWRCPKQTSTNFARNYNISWELGGVESTLSPRVSLTQIRRPGAVPELVDGTALLPQYAINGWELQDDWIAGKVVHWRHQNTANVTYVDGHVGQTTRAVWKQFRLSFQRSEIIK